VYIPVCEWGVAHIKGVSPISPLLIFPSPFSLLDGIPFFAFSLGRWGQNRLLAWHPFPLLMTIAAVRRLFAKHAEQQQPRETADTS
jgi:hypothetical protein